MKSEPLEKAVGAETAAATESSTVTTSVRRVYRLIEDHIDSVGGMELAAGLCGVKRWDLRRALDRDDRYLPVDHVLAIAARMRLHNAGIATEIGAALVRPIELLVFPRVHITDAEARRRHENTLRKIGAAMGVDLVAQSLEDPT